MLFAANVLHHLMVVVERAHRGLPFWQAALRCVSASAHSGFSEYEIYFNFVRSYYTQLVRLRRNFSWVDVDSPALQPGAGYTAALQDVIARQMAKDPQTAFVAVHSYKTGRGCESWSKSGLAFAC